MKVEEKENSNVPQDPIMEKFFKLSEEYDFENLLVSTERAIEYFFNLYQIKSSLGKGGFAIVLSAIVKATKEECAIKIIEKDNHMNFDKEILREEAKLLKSLEHENIIRYINVHETNDLFFLVTELLEGGSLSSYLAYRNENLNPLKDEEIRIIMKQIFEGMKFIHDKHIIHRDLKPENILLKNKGSIKSLKIIDFGIGAKQSWNGLIGEKAKYGTRPYMAPEQFLNDICIIPSDIWAAGVILYQLSTSSFPFYGTGKEETSYNRILQKMKLLPKKLDNFHPMKLDLFKKLCQYDFNLRYTAEEALLHPFITKEGDSIPKTLFEEFFEEINLENALEKYRTSLLIILFISNCLNNMKYKYFKNESILANWECETQLPKVFINDIEQIDDKSKKHSLKISIVDVYKTKIKPEMSQKNTEKEFQFNFLKETQSSKNYKMPEKNTYKRKSSFLVENENERNNSSINKKSSLTPSKKSGTVFFPSSYQIVNESVKKTALQKKE